MYAFMQCYMLVCTMYVCVYVCKCAKALQLYPHVSTLSPFLPQLLCTCSVSHSSAFLCIKTISEVLHNTYGNVNLHDHVCIVTLAPEIPGATEVSCMHGFCFVGTCICGAFTVHFIPQLNLVVNIRVKSYPKRTHRILRNTKPICNF